MRLTILLLSFLCSISIGNAQITNGLVSHFAFDSSATIAYPSIVDDSGMVASSNNAYMGNVQLMMDRNNMPNQALYFDGTNGQRAYIDADVVNTSNDYTFAHWVYVETGSSGGGRLVGGRYGGSANAIGGPHTYLTASNEVEVSVWGSNGGTLLARATSSALTPGTWYHVAVTKSGTTLKLYLNGVLQQQDVLTAASPNIMFWNIGGRSVSNSLTHEGGIDDIIFYDRALSQSEVTQLNANTIVPTNLVAHFSFDNYEADPLITDAQQNITPSAGAYLGGVRAVTGYDGMRANALSFDGTSGQRAYIDADIVNTTNDYTFAHWVYVDPGSSGGSRLVGGRYGGSANAIGGPHTYLTASNEVEVSVWSSNAGTLLARATSSALTPGTWYHVAVTKSGTTLKLYLNGVMQQQDVLTAASPNISFWNIGGRSLSNSLTLEGGIDDITFYDRALSQSEVTQLSGGTLVANNLVAYYPFDAVQGNPLILDKEGSVLPANASYVGNVQAVADKDGLPNQAIGFDGTNGQRAFVDTNIVNTSNDFSLSYWFNANQLSGELLGGRYGAGGSAIGGPHTYINGNNSEVEVSFWGSNAGTLLGRISSSTINTNTWYNVTLTKSGSTIALYLDGVFQQQTTLSAASPNISFWNVGGRTVASNTITLDGELDEILFYDRALSSSEVTGLVLNTQKVEKFASVKLYPNPTKGWLTLELEEAAADRQLVISNVMGQTLLTKQGTDATVQLDVNALTAGAYFISVFEAGERVAVQKFIKE